MICNFFFFGSEQAKAVIAVPLKRAINETLQAKSSGGRRPRYVTSLRQYLAQFARGREETPVHEIDSDTIREWFSTRREAPATQAANLGRLGALFALCFRRGYIDDNPVLRVDKPFIEAKPPKILSLKACGRMLVYTMRRQPDLLAWLSLALLAGLRPEEADKIPWSAIDLQRGEVRVDAAASKVRTRRIVPLSLAAVSWLRMARQLDARLPISRSTRRRRIRQLREAMGFQAWPQDILRHTAASYLLAKHGDAGKVANMLGNSASILGRHYKELVPVENGRRFCSLLPTPAMVARRNVPPIA
jgi:integrase/recombinase XerD